MSSSTHLPIWWSHYTGTWGLWLGSIAPFIIGTSFTQTGVGGRRIPEGSSQGSSRNRAEYIKWGLFETSFKGENLAPIFPTLHTSVLTFQHLKPQTQQGAAAGFCVLRPNVWFKNQCCLSVLKYTYQSRMALLPQIHLATSLFRVD